MIAGSGSDPADLYSLSTSTVCAWRATGLRRLSVWVAATNVVIRFAADGDSWTRIACAIVHRELTAEEWQTFVSETEPQVAACQ